MIETNIKESFLDLFYHDIENLELDKSNKVNVFTLKVKNNAFAYDELVKLLSNQLCHFALSRTEVQKLIDAKEYATLVSKAQDKLRRYSSNEGADGVHLLKVTETNYQLIFGESKLNSNLQKGIYEAFGSLSKLLSENKIEFEIGLVNSQLIKETANPELYEFLKNVIVPNARENKISTDYSFGIFLGYDVGITEEESNKSNSEFFSKL